MDKYFYMSCRIPIIIEIHINSQIIAAGCGDCMLLQFIGSSGTPHNIIIYSGTLSFGKSFSDIMKQVSSVYGKVDAVFLTHSDDYHLGGMLYMVRHDLPLNVGVVFMNHADGDAKSMRGNFQLSAQQNDELYRRLVSKNITVKCALKGTVIRIDGAKMSIIAPKAERVDKMQDLSELARMRIPKVR